MAENAIIARSIYESWNDRDFDFFVSQFADDGEIVLVGSGERYCGEEGARQVGTRWTSAFPDARVRIDKLIEAGEDVVVECTTRGTQTGELLFPTATIEATGRSITLQLCHVLEIRTRKVRSLHSYYDFAALLAQLGTTVEPRTPTRA
jgi:predicted ester cyclase